MTLAVFKHTGDIGDVVYTLPAVRHMGGGRVLLSTRGLHPPKPDGTPSGLSEATARMLAPLLEAQPYVDGVGEWDGREVDVDLDAFRDGRDFNLGNLCGMILGHFGTPFDDVSRPWLSCRPRHEARAVFARSFRYRNEQVMYGVLRRKHPDAVFVGLPEEHADFVARFGHIPFRPVADFLEMAEVIAGAEVFVGNQSSPLAIAVGLGKPYVQEVCRKSPNCVFDLPGCKHLWGVSESGSRSLITLDRLEVLADAALRTKHLPGDLAEVGVYKGGSAAVIASAAGSMKALHLFDTFAGIPESCVMGGHRAGDFNDPDASLGAVRAFLRGLPVVFHPGVFPGSATKAADRTFSMVHLDADTYQATRAAIDFFLPRMDDGGLIVFDDWEWHACPGVKRAALERFRPSDLSVETPNQAVARVRRRPSRGLAIPLS